MATIRERKGRDGKRAFHVQVRLKGRPTQTATFSRKTDAKKWAQDTESAIRDGRHFKTSEAKRHTIGQLIDRYSKQFLPHKRDQVNQERQLRWWREQLGDLTLADVKPTLIAERRDRLASGLTSRGKTRSPATVNRYLAVLSHAFTVAVKEWGWMEDNPLRKVTRVKEPKGRVRYLTDEERVQLLQECQKSSSRYLYPVVVLALSTGARQGEIMNLRWSVVDLERGLASLHETKNSESRSLPLTGLSLELLRDLRKVRRIDTDLIFAREDGKKPANLRKPWLRAVRDAGIEDFRFHDLRHSAASYLAMNGATLAEIASVLGHKTLQMVKRYSHLSDAHVRGVVTRMNQRIFGL